MVRTQDRESAPRGLLIMKGPPWQIRTRRGLRSQGFMLSQSWGSESEATVSAGPAPSEGSGRGVGGPSLSLGAPAVSRPHRSLAASVLVWPLSVHLCPDFPLPMRTQVGFRALSKGRPHSFVPKLKAVGGTESSSRAGLQLQTLGSRVLGCEGVESQGLRGIRPGGQRS